MILALIFIQLGSDIGSHIPAIRIKKSDNRVQSQIVWRPTRSYISWVIKWRGYLVVVAKTSYWYIENLIIIIIRNSRILPICLKEGFYNVDPKVLTHFICLTCMCYILIDSVLFHLSKSVTVSFVVSKLGKKHMYWNWQNISRY